MIASPAQMIAMIAAAPKTKSMARAYFDSRIGVKGMGGRTIGEYGKILNYD